MSKKRITTVEELARRSQAEFLGINKRFDRLEQKVDNGFEVMESRFAKIDAKFDAVLEVIRGVRTDIRENTAAVNHRIDGLDKKVDRLEQKVFMK